MAPNNSKWKKICKEKGISTPEESIQHRMCYLTTEFDQSPQVVKEEICESLRKYYSDLCKDEGENYLSLESLKMKLTKDGAERNIAAWIKQCSDKLSGERFNDGYRNFVDTFVPEMFYSGKKTGFRKRRTDDPEPRPSMPLLNAFSTLPIEEGTQVKNTIIENHDIRKEREGGDLNRKESKKNKRKVKNEQDNDNITNEEECIIKSKKKKKKENKEVEVNITDTNEEECIKSKKKKKKKRKEVEKLEVDITDTNE